MSVCTYMQRSLLKGLTNELTELNEMFCTYCNYPRIEDHLQPLLWEQYCRIERGMIFAFLWTLISWMRVNIKKRQMGRRRCATKRSIKLIPCAFFRYLLHYLSFSCFSKTFVTSSKKVLTVKISWMIIIAGIESIPSTRQSGRYFPQNCWKDFFLCVLIHVLLKCLWISKRARRVLYCKF